MSLPFPIVTAYPEPEHAGYMWLPTEERALFLRWEGFPYHPRPPLRYPSPPINSIRPIPAARCHPRLAAPLLLAAGWCAWFPPPRPPFSGSLFPSPMLAGFFEKRACPVLDTRQSCRFSFGFPFQQPVVDITTTCEHCLPSILTFCPSSQPPNTRQQDQTPETSAQRQSLLFNSRHISSCSSSLSPPCLQWPIDLPPDLSQAPLPSPTVAAPFSVP